MFIREALLGHPAVLRLHRCSEFDKSRSCDSSCLCRKKRSAELLRARRSVSTCPLSQVRLLAERFVESARHWMLRRAQCQSSWTSLTHPRDYPPVCMRNSAGPSAGGSLHCLFLLQLSQRRLKEHLLLGFTTMWPSGLT